MTVSGRRESGPDLLNGDALDHLGDELHCGRHDEVDEADLRVGHRRVVAVAERGHGEPELLLAVALPEELLDQSLGPLPVHVPALRRVADVRRMQNERQRERFVDAAHMSLRVYRQSLYSTLDVRDFSFSDFDCLCLCPVFLVRKYSTATVRVCKLIILVSIIHLYSTSCNVEYE